MRWTRARRQPEGEDPEPTRPDVSRAALTVGGFVIREARRQDASTVAALWKEMMDFHTAVDPRFRFSPGAQKEFEEHFLSTLRSREGRVIVAESEGDVVGYILGEIHVRRPLYPAGTYGFISDVVVREDYRQRGVGRALVERMTAWFRHKGVTSIELFAAERNAVSAAFWQALGYDGFLRLMRRELSADEPPSTEEGE